MTRRSGATLVEVLVAIFIMGIGMLAMGAGAIADEMDSDASEAKGDAAMAEATRLSGSWLVCKAGCAECCLGPFPITQLDARRLRA